MIHWMPLKSPCSETSNVGRITGTLEISNPNIRAAKHTASSATVLRAAKGWSVCGRVGCSMSCACMAVSLGDVEKGVWLPAGSAASSAAC